MVDLVRIDIGSFKVFVIIVVKQLVQLVLVCGKLNLCYISLLIYWGMLKDYYDDEEI